MKMYIRYTNCYLLVSYPLVTEKEAFVKKVDIKGYSSADMQCLHCTYY